MASKTHEIAFKIAGKLAGNFSGAFKNAAKAVADLQGSTGKLIKTAQNTGSLLSLARATENARKKNEAAAAALRAMRAEIKNTAAPTQKQYAALQRAATAAKNARFQYDKTSAELKELKNASGVAEINVGKLTKQFQRQKQAADMAKKALAGYNKTKGQIEGVNNKIAGIKSGMASNVGAIAGVAGAAAATVGVPIKEAMAYEDAMADVTKVVSFSKEEMEAFNGSISKMSSEIALSSPELLNIAAAWGATGKRANELAEYTELTAKGAVAMGMSAEEAGNMMAKWAGGMGLTLGQTKELANLTNELSNNMSAAAPEIGDFLQRVGASGGLKGMDANNMAALGAALINAGNSAEVAATGAREFITILGAKTWSPKQAAAFEELGFKSNEAMAKAMIADAPGTIQKVLDAIAKMRADGKEAQANAIMDAAFGSTAGEAVGKLVKNADGYSLALKTIASESAKTNSLQKEFEARNATTSNSLVLMKNAASAVARAIGEPLLEPIRAFSNSIVKMTPAITEWVKKNQGLIMGALKIAGVIGGAIIAVNGLALAFSAIILPLAYAVKAFLLLKQGFMWIKGLSFVIKIIAGVKSAFAALNITMLASPWFWVVAAIVAVVAAGVLLYKNFDSVRAKVDALWLAFYNSFPNIATVVGSVISIVVTAVKGLWVVIKMVFYSVWEVIKAVIAGIVSSFKGWLNQVEAVIDFFATLFSKDSTWGDVWDSFKNVVDVSIKGALNNLINFVNVGIGAINGLIKGLNGIKLPDWLPGGLGGMSVNIPEIPKIPQMAKGGVVNQSTLANIGEAGPEAVIPLKKLETMIGGGGGFTFAPVINVSGGANAYDDVKRAINESKADLRREIDRYFADKRRLSYV